MSVPARLKLLDPTVRQALGDASAQAQRRIAITVSRLAVNRVGIADSRVDAALKRLQDGLYGDSPERGAMQMLIDELDEAAWVAQDRVEAGGADETEYVKAFVKARAVNSVWYALDMDPLEAAAEATYEATAAIEDPEAIRTAIRNTLT